MAGAKVPAKPLETIAIAVAGRIHEMALRIGAAGYTIVQIATPSTMPQSFRGGRAGDIVVSGLERIRRSINAPGNTQTRL
jgi:hypothetical protein